MNKWRIYNPIYRSRKCDEKYYLKVLWTNYRVSKISYDVELVMPKAEYTHLRDSLGIGWLF